ncbi:type III-B CRISPR module RAMP protein Cmr4 [Vibrio spartinae]|uniref:CRISPR type III-B/RAMP module RAMP protein Cmr4 n=1 Tax=Vibrio spartinae TaxID=1918945 RepID=A0ABX6R500_9VIBR|nr:type III-B CRISPR module RAMP protein Cmr4 [Vibrio spartinae]QMV15990.1 CRISPR type III-B/RAMP module RAMP protein Cmr4 [Vibrio spartinae]
MTTNNILLMRAETFVHAGAGSGNGLIDLPIMREAHNNWPVIFGSAVKGAFRAKASQDIELQKKLKNWFGDDSESGNGAGALMFGDARLLWLPVRSLNSHTLWVTSPSVLSRFARDMRRMGQAFPNNNYYQLADNEVVTLYHQPNTQLILEDYCLNIIPKEDHEDIYLWLEELKNRIAEMTKQTAQEGALLVQETAQKLVMVSDTVFTHLCTMATPVTPHVKLEPQTKANNNLWYVETLPPETMLYSTLIYTQRLTDQAQLNHLLKDYIQIGGNETTGMGWFELYHQAFKN